MELIKLNLQSLERIRTWELVGVQEILEVIIFIVFMRLLTDQLYP